MCQCSQYHVNAISIICANAVSITSMQSELCWHHMYQYQYYVSQQSLSYVSCITVDSIYMSLVISGMTWHLVGDVELWERVSLASHTLCRERKGLVMLQPSSCPHGRNLMWPIRSVHFVDHIHCHGVQLRHNVFSGCQHLIAKLLYLW